MSPRNPATAPRRTLRARWRRLRDDEDGQTTVMIIGLSLIVILLATVILGVTAVNIEARKLLSTADAATRAATAGIEPSDTRGRSTRIDPTQASNSIEEYLTQIGANNRFDNFGVASVRVEGSTVILRLEATAHPPLSNWVVPSGVPITVEASARLNLEK